MHSREINKKKNLPENGLRIYEQAIRRRQNISFNLFNRKRFKKSNNLWYYQSCETTGPQIPSWCIWCVTSHLVRCKWKQLGNVLTFKDTCPLA